MKLSIITINLNNCAGLQRTIDSVICQTYKDYEWIVVDGGSTDGSRELIEQNKHLFSWWCSEPDNGIYNAMNKGIKKANGEYLLFLNSADCLYNKDVLAKIDEEKHTADIIAGLAEGLDTHRVLRHYDQDVLMHIFVSTFDHQATFIRRKLLENRPYDEKLRMQSDWKFWLQAILYDNVNIEYSNTIVVIQDPCGISNQQIELGKQERRKILNEVLPPLLHKTLNDYQNLRINIEYRRLKFMKEQTPIIFWILHKVIALFTKFAKLFINNPPSQI